MGKIFVVKDLCKDEQDMKKVIAEETRKKNNVIVVEKYDMVPEGAMYYSGRKITQKFTV